jgi:hypothetical protein
MSKGQRISQILWLVCLLEQGWNGTRPIETVKWLLWPNEANNRVDSHSDFIEDGSGASDDTGDDEMGDGDIGGDEIGDDNGN